MSEFALRPVLYDDDHDWLVDLHNDPVVLENLTNPVPITMAQHLAWWDRISHDAFEMRLIFTVDGARAGFTKFYQINRANNNCTLGADLHQSYRGKGLANPMWKLMLNKCFDDIGLHRVSLTAAEFNEISQRVYRRLGFKEEGKLIQSLYRKGKYYDQIMMYLLRNDWELNNG
jgi:RimJ/RimL family protein N-acetyltransferase